MKILKIIFFPITIVCWLVKFVFNYLNRLRIKGFLKQLTLTKISALTGKQFEDVCSLIFKALGYKVNKTKTSNDFGADLIICKKFKTAVQCKLYYNHSVGERAIMEVSSGTKYYQANYGVVITNSKYSAQAKKLAKIENVLLIDGAEITTYITDLNNGTKHSKMFNLEKLLSLHLQNF